MESIDVNMMMTTLSVMSVVREDQNVLRTVEMTVHAAKKNKRETTGNLLRPQRLSPIQTSGSSVS